MLTGMFPGVEQPMALIGTSEKGHVDMLLEVTHEGGHSSMPPPSTAVGILATALARAEANWMPRALTGSTRALFAVLGQFSPLHMRVCLALIDCFFR